MECDGLEKLCIKDQTLTNESMFYFDRSQCQSSLNSQMKCKNDVLENIAGAEKVVGWAVSHYLMSNPEADADTRLVLSSERWLILISFHFLKLFSTERSVIEWDVC